MNPYGAQPRPAMPYEVFGYSGSCEEVLGSGKSFQVLKWAATNTQPQGFSGLSSVHISTKDVTQISNSQDAPNGQLVIDVSWQSGIGGGEAIGIDATRGTFFTVSGVSALNISARFVSSVAGEPIKLWATKRVEAVINWGTSISPKSAKVTLPSIALDGINGSGFFPIPPQAESVIALTRSPAQLPALEMRFSTDNAADGIKYATLNPNANGTPIVHGVEFVQFFSPQPMIVAPCFELWL